MTQEPNKINATGRTTLKRLPARGSYDRTLIHRILDEALVCHIAFIQGGQPFVLPTIHVRIGDRLFFHGSHGSRMMRVFSSSAPVCAAVSIIDGIVLARSAFHHSINYRSVVVFGRGEEVSVRREKTHILRRLVEHVAKGRSADIRSPDARELDATAVASLPISEASAKTRSGPPDDDETDCELPIWAGVVPLALRASAPVPDERVPAGLAVPGYALDYRRPV